MALSYFSLTWWPASSIVLQVIRISTLNDVFVLFMSIFFGFATKMFIVLTVHIFLAHFETANIYCTNLFHLDDTISLITLKKNLV